MRTWTTFWGVGQHSATLPFFGLDAKLTPQQTSSPPDSPSESAPQKSWGPAAPEPRLPAATVGGGTEPCGFRGGPPQGQASRLAFRGGRHPGGCYEDPGRHSAPLSRAGPQRARPRSRKGTAEVDEETHAYLHAWLHKGPADIDEQIPSNRCVIDRRTDDVSPAAARSEAPRSTVFGKGTSPVDPYPPCTKEPEAIGKPWAANSRRPILKPRE